MRQIFLGAIGVFAASAALASSLEVIGSDAQADNGSIIVKQCQTCPPLQAVQAKKEYVVPTLADGALQQSQVRDVGGEKKLYRTEGWMGGSPIVFVTKAPTESMTASAPSAPAVDGIDLAATTSIAGDAKPVAAGVAGPAVEPIAPLDVSSFKLRP
jgi:hypothetical protein